MLLRRSTSRSVTSSSLAPDSSRMRCCRSPDRRGTGRTRAVHPVRRAVHSGPGRAVHPVRRVGRPAAASHHQRDLAMVVARSDWARLLPTRPCRPSTGRDLVRRPDRDTTQGSHSRAESMCRRGRPHVDKASRYQTHSMRKPSTDRATRLPRRFTGPCGSGPK